MTEALPRMSGVSRIFVLLAAGAAVGVVGANSFADAAGIYARHEDTDVILRVVCGFVLGLATIALVVAAGHFGALGVAALRQSSRRPNPAMAMTLVICGTVCLLITMAFQWYVVASSQVIRPEVSGAGGAATINLPGIEKKATISVSGSGALRLGAGASLASHLMALACFVAGAVLIGLGVWSSMSNKAEATGPSPLVPRTPRRRIYRLGAALGRRERWFTRRPGRAASRAAIPAR